MGMGETDRHTDTGTHLHTCRMDPLELELQVVVDCYVGAGNQKGSSERTTSDFLKKTVLYYDDCYSAFFKTRDVNKYVKFI